MPGRSTPSPPDTPRRRRYPGCEAAGIAGEGDAAHLDTATPAGTDLAAQSSRPRLARPRSGCVVGHSLAFTLPTLEHNAIAHPRPPSPPGRPPPLELPSDASSRDPSPDVREPRPARRPAEARPQHWRWRRGSEGRAVRVGGTSHEIDAGTRGGGAGGLDETITLEKPTLAPYDDEEERDGPAFSHAGGAGSGGTAPPSCSARPRRRRSRRRGAACADPGWLSPGYPPRPRRALCLRRLHVWSSTPRSRSRAEDWGREVCPDQGRFPPSRQTPPGLRPPTLDSGPSRPSTPASRPPAAATHASTRRRGRRGPTSRPTPQADPPRRGAWLVRVGRPAPTRTADALAVDGCRGCGAHH